MHARNIGQGIGVIFAITAGLCTGVACAGTVHIYGGDFNLPIPATPQNPDEPDSKGWMQDAVINVTDHILISDLDVRINLNHTNVFDLQLFLQSPLGTTICLNIYDFEKDFFQGSDYTNTVFDDEAELPIEQAEPPFIGRFRPKAIDTNNTLQAFDNLDAYGTWRLQIYDAFWSDTGNLNSFEIIITTPEPTTAALLTLSTALMALLRPRQRK